MTCERVREALSAMPDGEGSSEERESVEAHLATCAACQEAESELRSVTEGMRDLPKFQPPSRIRRRAMIEAASSAWEVRSQTVRRERDGAKVVEWRIANRSRFGKSEEAALSPARSSRRLVIEVFKEDADGSRERWTRATN